MKSQISRLLFLAMTFCLLNVTIPSNAGEPKPVISKRVNCFGVPNYFYGLIYNPGMRVVYNGSLYMCIQQNQYQMPFMGQYWAWMGNCN